MEARGFVFPAIVFVAWVLLFAVVFRMAEEQAQPADFLTRQTARVAILFWGLAAAALLWNWRDGARWLWTFACAAFLVHVATAFDRVHAWSHTAAHEHVENVSGFGPGIFISYAFTILWVVDVAWWWTDRSSYDRRSKWLDRGVHGFMAFVVFNGTVVYETGFIRWASVVMFSLLGCLVFRRVWLHGSGNPVQVGW
jgi:hypothetical protein